jgi:hypothetical protein
LISEELNFFAEKNSSATGALWFIANCNALSSKIVRLNRFRSGVVSFGTIRPPEHETDGQAISRHR